MNLKIKSLVYSVFLIVSTLVVIKCTPSKNLTTKEGLITGYVYAEVSTNQDKKKQIYLPDVLVTVLDSSGNKVSQTKTDLDGGYRTKIIPKGSYRIQLSKNGFVATTHSATVTFSSNHPGMYKINLKDNYIYGKALLADGFPAVFRNEVFGIEFFTRVFSGNEKDSNYVRCNTSGQFILPIFKSKNRTLITAIAQKAKTQLMAQPNGAENVLTFKNHKPKVQYIVARNSSGNAVLRTTPSEKLSLQAHIDDPDGQSLDYMWLPHGAYPGSTFTNSDEAKWVMTDIKANNALTLLVLDGYGGAAMHNYHMVSIDGKVAFSGVVKDIDGSGPIADASIKVNGIEFAKSDANGYFSIRVDESKNNRYTLNAEKKGYMLSSTIFQKDAHNQTYELVKATIKEFDPNKDIVLTEEEDKFTRFTNRKQNKETQTRKAASLKIPAGSIVDKNGNRVQVPVTVQMRVVDLNNPRGLMPGDYTAIEGASFKALVSFGAMDVQIRDKANPELRYNLNKESSADISIPISSDLLASSPNSIALWDYNETTGIWEKITDVEKSGASYVGKTNMFSTINTDVAITGGTCIHLTDNPVNPIFPGSDCDVTITIPTSGAPRIKTTTISAADPALTIARLPLNTDIDIVIKRGANTVAARTIRTSSSSSADASSINPADPATVCTIDFFKKTPPIADVLGSFAPFLSRVSTPDVNQALAYYKSSGAITDINGNGLFELSEGETFDQWKTRNNFGAPNTDDAHASFFNGGDLGFHRAMHMKKTSNHIAYYVSNYGNFPDAEADVFGTRIVVPAATVAMEYDIDASTGVRGVMKFYLFKGPTEVLETSVDLDGNGEKFIPGLCIECHGGQETDYTLLGAGTGLRDYYNTNPNNTPTFLSFDLQSFDYSAAHTRNSQDTNFRALNQGVMDANPTQAIIDFLRAAYNTAAGALSGIFNDDSVIPNWTAGNTNGVSNSFFYQSVYGPSCRTCHSSRSTNPALQFNTPADFNAFPVCGSGKYMPNAQVTFNNFWTSTNPYQPEQVRLFTGEPICE